LNIIYLLPLDTALRKVGGEPYIGYEPCLKIMGPKPYLWRLQPHGEEFVGNIIRNKIS
jgi:hypothetical protein